MPAGIAAGQPLSHHDISNVPAIEHEPRQITPVLVAARQVGQLRRRRPGQQITQPMRCRIAQAALRCTFRAVGFRRVAANQSDRLAFKVHCIAVNDR